MSDREIPVTPELPERPTMLAAMRLACRAPSVHNSQPWRWVFDGTRLHLYGDPDRQLPSMDPQGRQLVISCGAVLHHVRTAFATYNWHTEVVRLPDPAQPWHLAVIDFLPWPHPPAELRAQTAAIHHRYTDRLPMLAPGHWEAVTRRLRKQVSPYDIRLDVLDESAREQLIAASEQQTASRRYDMPYQNELRWWTRHADMPAGVPPSAMVSEAEFARVGVGRTFPPVPDAARRGEIDDRARVVVLSSGEDTVRDWLLAGEALSAFLLECTVAGLATCALTHITELPAGRALLHDLIPHKGVPQVLVRVGTAPHPEELPPTPRRPLAEVFTERPV